MPVPVPGTDLSPPAAGALARSGQSEPAAAAASLRPESEPVLSHLPETPRPAHGQYISQAGFMTGRYNIPPAHPPFVLANAPLTTISNLPQ